MAKNSIRESIHYEKLNNKSFYIWRIKEWRLLIEVIEPGNCYKLTFPADDFSPEISRYYNYHKLIDRLSDLFTCEYVIIKDKLRHIFLETQQSNHH